MRSAYAGCTFSHLGYSASGAAAVTPVRITLAGTAIALTGCSFQDARSNEGGVVWLRDAGGVRLEGVAFERISVLEAAPLWLRDGGGYYSDAPVAVWNRSAAAAASAQPLAAADSSGLTFLSAHDPFFSLVQQVLTIECMPAAHHWSPATHCCALHPPAMPCT
jgi:hypothetical protein